MEEMDGKLEARLRGYGLNEISPPQVLVQELKIPAGCEASGHNQEIAEFDQM